VIDSKSIVYLPRWMKVLALPFFFGLIALSAYVCIAFIGIPDRTDWILIALSVTQLSITAFIITLVLIFGERDANLAMLTEKTHKLLQEQLPAVLRKIEDSQGHKAKVSHSTINNIFGTNYLLETPTISVKLWICLNVDRVIICYFINRTLPTEQIRQIFRYTFGGAESVGYKVNFEEASIKATGEDILSIWCTWPAIQDSSNLATELLSNPEKKLFIIQDIAMMTQSFIRTAERNELETVTRADPGPL
jgi:hypothetical protein